VADRLRRDGWRARVVADDNGLVDRAAAHRAGLGWFGRNSLLLLPGRGSWFVLGSVVTDAPLEPTPPSGPSGHGAGCGSCRRCVRACPTGALVADGVLDARRCLAWLVQAPGAFPVEFREALGDRIYGCDDCQQVCPVNRTGARRRPPPPPEPGSVAAVDLLDLLGSSDRDLLAAHGRWYIADRDPRYLRRNALVALGNVGDGTDPATVDTLARYVTGDDELLAEHARWAARRLGRHDLADGSAARPSRSRR
jgi:epoxyqueuosine reductase